MKNLDERAARWLRVRIAILGLALGVAASALIVRAYDIQIGQSSELRQMADSQHLRAFRVSPRRGTIYDRAGTELAVSVDVDSVFANPRQLRANEVKMTALVDKLSRLLDVDRAVLRRRLSSDRYFAWIKRQVTPKQAAVIAKMDIPGLELTKESRRYYPNRHLASHLLGFANVDGRGIEGLELEFDNLLKGADRRVPAVRDRRGKVVFSEQWLDERESQGHSLTLTIDKTIQHIAERELSLAVRTFEARAGSVVVMDPNSGELLAVANYPSFNPNEAGRYEAAARRNRALTDRFEPGSTIKPFTMVAALSAKVVGPYQKIDCEKGAFRVGGRVIHDTSRYEKLTPAQILAHSSNIGTAKIATALGRKRLYTALRAFGFGKATGLELPGEAAGTLRPYKRWYEIDTAAVSFGQGFSVNSVQIATAMGAIANGGRLLQPTLLKRVVDGHERVVSEARLQVKRRVAPAKVTRLVADMLTAVTGPGGTGRQAAVDGYLVAGKTGTAQKADYVAGGYSEGKWVASFVGFLPADNPQVVVSVMIDEPVIAHTGGKVAGPVFRRVASATMRHLGVPPTNHQAPVAKVEPPTEISVEESYPIEPPTGHGQSRVPDLRGLPIREALVRLHARSLVPAVQGTGVLIAQDVRWGTVVPHGAVVRLTFERPGFVEAADIEEPQTPLARADQAGRPQ